MIGICVNKNVKKIGLVDNSYLECDNEKIPLIYLRTLTKGEPYYIKFGFYPINHNNNKNEYDYHKDELQIYIDNKNIYKKKPVINKKTLIKILNYRKFDEKKDILATKDDIMRIENKLNDQLKWLMATMIAVGGFIIAIIKLT